MIPLWLIELDLRQLLNILDVDICEDVAAEIGWLQVCLAIVTDVSIDLLKGT